MENYQRDLPYPVSYDMVNGNNVNHDDRPHVDTRRSAPTFVQNPPINTNPFLDPAFDTRPNFHRGASIDSPIYHQTPPFKLPSPTDRKKPSPLRRQGIYYSLSADGTSIERQLFLDSPASIGNRLSFNDRPSLGEFIDNQAVDNLENRLSPNNKPIFNYSKTVFRRSEANPQDDYINELNEQATTRPSLKCHDLGALGIVLDPSGYIRLRERARQRASAIRVEDFNDYGEKRAIEEAKQRANLMNFDNRRSVPKPERRPTPFPDQYAAESIPKTRPGTETSRFGFHRSMALSQPALKAIPKAAPRASLNSKQVVQPRWR
uniref:Pal1-domain-containing protein n=1 Tax=Panagrellus redivivus TaxID=6233 RepID=A0A7E4ZQ71_PANRE